MHVCYALLEPRRSKKEYKCSHYASANGLASVKNIIGEYAIIIASPTKFTRSIGSYSSTNRPICLGSNRRPADIARPVQKQRWRRPLAFQNCARHTHSPGQIEGACELQGPHHSVAIPDVVVARAGCGCRRGVAESPLAAAAVKVEDAVSDVVACSAENNVEVEPLEFMTSKTECFEGRQDRRLDWGGLGSRILRTCPWRRLSQVGRIVH